MNETVEISTTISRVSFGAVKGFHSFAGVGQGHVDEVSVEGPDEQQSDDDGGAFGREIGGHTRAHEPEVAAHLGGQEERLADDVDHRKARLLATRRKDEADFKHEVDGAQSGRHLDEGRQDVR